MDWGRRHASAWMISGAVHAAIAIVLMAALGRGHPREAEQTLARLVYVEPVSPRLASDVAPAPAAPAVAPPAPEIPKLTRDPPVPEVRRPPVPVPAPKPLRPRNARPIASEPVPPPAASDATGEAPAVPDRAEGARLGTATGVTGGAVGGLGEAPFALRDVAAPPEFLVRVVPDYPARARAMQIEGQVMLEVVLDCEGRVESGIRIVRSIPVLDESAIAAVRQWRFRPARDRDGRPVRVVMEVPVRFVLR